MKAESKVKSLSRSKLTTPFTRWVGTLDNQTYVHVSGEDLLDELPPNETLRARRSTT